MTPKTTEIDALERAVENYDHPDVTGGVCSADLASLIKLARSHLERLKADGGATSMQIIEIGKDQYGEPLTVMGKHNAISALERIMQTAQPTTVDLEGLKALLKLGVINPTLRGRGLLKENERKAYNEGVVKTIDYLAQSGHLGIQGDWRPIETAPKDGTEIILALYSGHPSRKSSFCWVINGHFDTDKDAWCSYDPMIGKLVPPSHWKPIGTPAAPRDAG